MDVRELNSLIKQTIIDAFEGTAATEGFIKYKSELISTTTTTYSQGASQKVISDELELDRVWISQRDGDVRPSHRKVDGQRANKSGLFEVGGYKTEHPAGSGLPAKEACNCRCITISQKKKL